MFSSVTRLLALPKSTVEAPHRQFAKRANRPFPVSSSSLARLPRYSLTMMVLTLLAETGMVHSPRGNVGEDGRRSAQQGLYRFHLMHIMEDSVFYSGLALLYQCSYYCR